MRNRIYIFLFSLLSYQISFGQIFSFPNTKEETPKAATPPPAIINPTTNTTPNFIYKNEFSGQFLIGSRGLGINFRRAQNMTIEKKRLFEFDLAYVNHPKEFKIKARNNDFRNAKCRN
jgi:hypothetical protein